MSCSCVVSGIQSNSKEIAGKADWQTRKLFTEGWTILSIEHPDRERAEAGNGLIGLDKLAGDPTVTGWKREEKEEEERRKRR